MNGPLPDSVSASPAAFTAVTSVEKEGLPAAISTIVPGVACAVVLDCATGGVDGGAVGVDCVVAGLGSVTCLAASLEQAVVMPTVTERIEISPIVRTDLDKEVNFMAANISKRMGECVWRRTI